MSEPQKYPEIPPEVQKRLDEEAEKTRLKVPKASENRVAAMKASNPPPKKKTKIPTRNPDFTDFRRQYLLFGQPKPYDVKEHTKYTTLLEKQPYNSGYLLLEFIKRRNGSLLGTGLDTAANNIKIRKGISLVDRVGYGDLKMQEDYPGKGIQGADAQLKTEVGEAEYKRIIKKITMLNGRLHCRFRSVYEFKDDLIAALPEEIRDVEGFKIEKALHNWAVRGNGVDGKKIFEKGAQNDVVKQLKLTLAELPEVLEKDILKKKELAKRLEGGGKDLLWKIEEEMADRRRGKKLAAATLFQDLVCNPDAVVFKQGQAFLIKDGDRFSMIGGREEDWEPLILACLKYINDKDPWSARPSFTGSPEFVTFAISVARKYTIRWAINDQTMGTGYPEAFFQFGDQVQHIQQGSPQHHEQGFWVETVVVFDPEKPAPPEKIGVDKDGKDIWEKRYEVMWENPDDAYPGSPNHPGYKGEDKRIAKTMSIVCWDPVVAAAALKDVDWTVVRNFACERPSYELGVVRKNYNDMHRQARQGVLMKYKEGSTGQREVDSDWLMNAELMPLSPEQYENINREVFQMTYHDYLEGRTPKERQLKQNIQIQDQQRRQAGEHNAMENPTRRMSGSIDPQDPNPLGGGLTASLSPDHGKEPEKPKQHVGQPPPAPPQGPVL